MFSESGLGKPLSGRQRLVYLVLWATCCRAKKSTHVAGGQAADTTDGSQSCRYRADPHPSGWLAGSDSGSVPKTAGARGLRSATSQQMAMRCSATSQMAVAKRAMLQATRATF